MTAPIDVRRLDYMPLYLDRLQNSRAWKRCAHRPELAYYLMNLWMKAYREVPAGSLENDDEMLCYAANCSPDNWERLRADIMRGWEERDGRLYHPVVEEIATEAATKLRGSAEKTAAAREALARIRAKGQGALNLCGPSVTMSVTEHEAEAEAEVEAERDKTPAPPSTTLREVPASPGGAAPLETRLREAAGIGLGKILKAGLSEIEALAADGVSVERVILPAVRAVAERSGSKAKAWAYFLDAIRERMAGAVPAAGAAPQLAVASVWVRKDSPQGRAWDEHVERVGGRAIAWLEGGRSGVGRSLDSEWPPDHPNHTPAREVA